MGPSVPSHQPISTHIRFDLPAGKGRHCWLVEGIQVSYHHDAAMAIGSTLPIARLTAARIASKQTKTVDHNVRPANILQISCNLLSPSSVKFLAVHHCCSSLLFIIAVLHSLPLSPSFSLCTRCLPPFSLTHIHARTPTSTYSGPSLDSRTPQILCSPTPGEPATWPPPLLRSQSRREECNRESWICWIA